MSRFAFGILAVVLTAACSHREPAPTPTPTPAPETIGTSVQAVVISQYAHDVPVLERIFSDAVWDMTEHRERQNPTTNDFVSWSNQIQGKGKCPLQCAEQADRIARVIWREVKRSGRGGMKMHIFRQEHDRAHVLDGNHNWVRIEWERGGALILDAFMNTVIRLPEGATAEHPFNAVTRWWEVTDGYTFDDETCGRHVSAQTRLVASRRLTPSPNGQAP